MDETEGLICAYALDGQGAGHPLDWAALEGGEARGPAWVHLDRNAPRAQRWLTASSGLSELAVEALLAEETRPRCEPMGEGVLLILRGVNLNPGSDPDDMVSLRIWADARRLISVRLRRLAAVQDQREALEAGRGPRDIEELLASLALHLVNRMGPTVTALDEDLDTIEAELVSSLDPGLRGRLQRLRHTAVTLRRYIAPQRDALQRLAVDAPAWLTPKGRSRLRETTDRVTRYVEDLDAVRERAAVVQDELANQLAERLNRRLYVLSIVAGVFLPLGFVTGLLGINVGGIPGADVEVAFAVVTAGLIALGAFEIWLFKRAGWL